MKMYCPECTKKEHLQQMEQFAVVVGFDPFLEGYRCSICGYEIYQLHTRRFPKPNLGNPPRIK